MVISIQQLLDKYKDYVDPKGKIRRDVESGKLFHIVRGLYETDRNVDGSYLAQFIYGPSYLSFEYVLSKYGLIPEEAKRTYTCATFGKRRRKHYANAFGDYLYRDVPKEVYPYGFKIVVQGNYCYHIATPEKALCDKLYVVEPVASMKSFKALLFDDLRIDEEEFDKLDKEFIRKIAPLYKKRNLNWLAKMVEEAS